ncbi:MAG TPA: histidine phosphatase family protein [Kofleriaceae bacterium]|nr:histidine phosphatase family protein [Kofleriaceae bacterium]
MSRLFLIRHGQASFGADDYDVLSATGIRQAQCLGEHLARFAPAFDAVYCGPKKRHLGTARHLIDAASDGGRTLPEPVVIDGLDEYPAFELLRQWMPALQEDPELRDILDPKASPAVTQRAFSRVIARWVNGDLATGDLESFAEFCARVSTAIDRIIAAEGRKKNILVVTSGGPIAATLRRALGLCGEVMMKVSWVVANASLTELRYREDELSLYGFNACHHLVASDLITYR